MSNIPKIEKVIKRIIIPQHPELTEFEVKDLFLFSSFSIRSSIQISLGLYFFKFIFHKKRSFSF